MTNKLQTMIPALFQPIDLAYTGDQVPKASARRAEKLSTLAAIALAVLVVGLIAVLMGMT